METFIVIVLLVQTVTLGFLAYRITRLEEYFFEEDDH